MIKLLLSEIFDRKSTKKAGAFVIFQKYFIFAARLSEQIHSFLTI